MLIILSGLPGVGKTTIARRLALELGAIHLRIDTIEQAIRDSGVVTVSLDDAGYRVGYALAEDNLRLGRIVIADSVNPLPLTRDAWVSVARRADVPFLEVEMTCADVGEHKRRIEMRSSDLIGLKELTWAEVAGRDYRPWDRERTIIDTARSTIEDSVAKIRSAITRDRSVS